MHAGVPGAQDKFVDITAHHVAKFFGGGVIDGLNETAYSPPTFEAMDNEGWAMKGKVAKALVWMEEVWSLLF